MKDFDKREILTTRDRIAGVLFDRDDTIMFGDKLEVKAKLNAVNEELNV
jgi:hypothetical protein